MAREATLSDSPVLEQPLTGAVHNPGKKHAGASLFTRGRGAHAGVAANATSYQADKQITQLVAHHLADAAQ
eukprot:6185904-Pleurochrysis_carterae.AAC.1